MASFFKSLTAIGFLVLMVASLINAAAIDNSVGEPRVHTTDELISNIVDNCFNSNAMHCIKEKVLTYLDTVNGVQEDISGRAFDDDVIDKVIVDRVARILNSNEIQIQLPETVFARSIITYRADRGFDMVIPETEARHRKKKDKLFLPLLLLMKFKLKVIMPIIMTLIGLKAFKALILSKIAIKLVIGFIIYNLIQKLGALKMTMTPMMPAPEASTSSYEPTSWDSSGGPYARWDSQNLAYNAYHPSSSYSSSSTGSS